MQFQPRTGATNFLCDLTYLTYPQDLPNANGLVVFDIRLVVLVELVAGPHT